MNLGFFTMPIHPLEQGLAAVAARGPRGVHPGRRARLHRRLCRRAPHRPRREHHLVHDVHLHADRGDQAHQARHRHDQHAEQPSGRGRGERRDARSSARRPLHLRHLAGRACCRTPRCSAISMPTATRCSSNASTRCWRSGASEPPYNIKGKYWNIVLERQLMLDLGQGYLPKPLQQPHPPIVVTAVAPFSKGVTEAAARGWDPISANFLMPQWVKTPLAEICRGLRARRAPGRSGQLARGEKRSSSPTTTRPRERYATDPNGPYRYYYSQLYTKLKRGNRHIAFKTRQDQPDDGGHARRGLRQARVLGLAQPRGRPDPGVPRGDRRFRHAALAGKDWKDRARPALHAAARREGDAAGERRDRQGINASSVNV